MTLRTMTDLYVNLLQDTHNAEKQLIKALPRVAKAAAKPQLAEAVLAHLEETKQQAARLERILKDLQKRPGGENCEAMEGLIEECKELIDADADDSVRDAAMIVAAQKVEHYEIAAYGSLCAFAKLLGRDEDLALLKQPSKEEHAANEHLNSLATSSVNSEAAATEGEELTVHVKSRRSGSIQGSRSRAR